MPGYNNHTQWQARAAQDIPARPRTLPLRRPATVWGWLIWALVVLLFWLLLSRVIAPWWYAPTPGPIVPPNVSSRGAS